MNKLFAFLVSGFMTIAVVAGFFNSVAYAENYNVQSIIGTYKTASSVCADESKVGHLVPCSRHCDNPATPNDETEPCSVCHIIVLGHNIVQYILYIAVFVALAVITFAGVMYIVSAGDQGMITTAKAALKYALFGMVFILAAWVIINTLITVLLKPNKAGGSLKGGWSQYYCESTDTGAGTNPDTGAGTNPDTGAGTNPDTGAGTNPDNKKRPDSWIPNPDSHSGVMYCAVKPFAKNPDLFIEMNRHECYTDENHCRNKFNSVENMENNVMCMKFDANTPKVRPYNSYKVYLDFMVKDSKGRDVRIYVNKYYPPSDDPLNPRKRCLDGVEKEYGDALDQYGDKGNLTICEGSLWAPNADTQRDAQNTTR